MNSKFHPMCSLCIPSPCSSHPTSNFKIRWIMWSHCTSTLGTSHNHTSDASGEETGLLRISSLPSITSDASAGRCAPCHIISPPMTSDTSAREACYVPHQLTKGASDIDAPSPSTGHVRSEAVARGRVMHVKYIQERIVYGSKILIVLLLSYIYWD
jgi:hypothetical protein